MKVPEEIYAEALAAHQRGKYELAEERYFEVLKHDYEESQAAYLLAVLYLKKRSYRDALVFVERSLAKQFDNVEALCCKSAVCAHLYDFVKAAEAARHALSLEPNNIEVVMRLGSALRRMGDFKEAEQVLRAALDANVNHAPLHAELGWLFQDKGQSEWAYGAFESALKIDENCIPARRGLGEWGFREGRLVVAEKNFGLVISLNNDMPEAHADLARLFLKFGRHEWAQGAFQSAVRKDSFYREGWLGLGETLTAMGRPRRAFNAYRSAWFIRPEDVEVTYAYAHSAFCIGEVHLAFGLLSGQQANWSRCPKMAELYGMVLQAKGERDNALEHFRESALASLNQQLGGVRG